MLETAALSPRVETPNPVRVLVVEDEAVVARDLERSLEDLGYHVLGTAGTGVEALELAREHRPDVTLMDIRLKGESDGVETAGTLRRELGLPIVYLTAYTDRATLARAAVTEPYGYVVKPYTRAEVRAAIEIAHHKHKVERTYRRRERWFSTVIESIEDAVITCNHDQIVNLMNGAAQRLLGREEKAVTGRPVSEVATLTRGGKPHDPQWLVHRAMVERAPQCVGGVVHVTRAGGEVVAAEESVVPILYEGEVLGAALLLRDVTEQTQVREKLALTERLTALATLAGGMAHEINNPLTYVFMNLEHLHRLLEGPEAESPSKLQAPELGAARKAVDLAMEGTDRIRRIVADLSLLGRPIEGPTGVTNVHECVQWALRVTDNQLRHRVSVTTDLQPVPPVVASDVRIGQVLVNMLLNALHAFGDRDRADNQIRVTTRKGEDGTVIITVSDNGAGIEPDLQKRIFEPFFTTKGPGEGTGLGLSICHGIVRALGGHIGVRSTPGRGTQFDVCLPAAKDAPSAQQPAAAKAIHSHRLLVIDDDPMVRETIFRTLHPQHEVVLADSAQTALHVLATAEQPDAILCDLMMPGMDGAELHEVLESRSPELAARMVFMTGGAFTDRAATFLATKRQRTLTKPFRREEIEDVLGRVVPPGHH